MIEIDDECWLSTIKLGHGCLSTWLLPTDKHTKYTQNTAKKVVIYGQEWPWVFVCVFVYMPSSPSPPSLSLTILTNSMTLQNPPRLLPGQNTWYKPPLTCHQGFDLAWPVPEVSSQPAAPQAQTRAAQLSYLALCIYLFLGIYCVIQA